jgi:hypothetical protein
MVLVTIPVHSLFPDALLSDHFLIEIQVDHSDFAANLFAIIAIDAA